VLSNFSAELNGHDFKAILHVLESTQVINSDNKNSLILYIAFLMEIQGSSEFGCLQPPKLLFAKGSSAKSGVQIAPDRPATND